MEREVFNVSVEEPIVSIEISPYYGKTLLGLNWYRNAGHYEKASVKKVYGNKFTKLLEPFTGAFVEKYRVDYTYNYKNELSDVPNVCSIIDKFFQDSLVSVGIAKNDNVKFCKEVRYIAGEKNRDNPSVRIDVYPTSGVLVDGTT